MSANLMHDIEEVATDGLLKAVDSLLLDGWRLIQILALSSESGNEINYSFGGGYAMKTLRVRLGPKDPVPSITSYYAAAAFYENEMRDLFGIRIERIHPDWHGDLLGGAKPRPFSRVRIAGTSVERPVPLNAPATAVPQSGNEGAAAPGAEGGSK